LSQQNQSSKTNSAAKPAEGAMGRSVPESLEAEAAVLGSMMLEPACIGQVVQQITTEVFYRPEHQIIFDAIIELYENSRELDLVLLRDELKKRNKLKAVGGVEYLVRIAESVPSAANAEHYTEIVKDKSILRDLISASSEILSDAYDPAGQIRDKLDNAEQKIFAVTEKKISGVAESLRGLLMEAFENIEARKGQAVTGLPTGFYELNSMLSGLQNGEMLIVAGRPSMGKTSFALNIAENLGVGRDIPVAVFSLEMSRQQLAERFLCSHARIDLQRVRGGLIDDDEHQHLQQACSELFDKPIYIDDTPGMTPLMIRAKCRRLKSQYDIQCVVIDYLQLMSLGGRVESRQQEISTISRYLKGLAKELNVPVIVLSQLNRAAEGREGHRPRMSDLRESGSIEQDADVVMLLHRDDYYHRGEEDYEDTNTADLIVAKQRNGPTGVVKLHFNAQFTRFENHSDVPADSPF